MKERTRASPRRRPNQKKKAVPANPPTVVKSSTPTTFRRPSATRKPAKGSTNSEGMGGIRFSTSESRARPAYPSVSTSWSMNVLSPSRTPLTPPTLPWKPRAAAVRCVPVGEAGTADRGNLISRRDFVRSAGAVGVATVLLTAKGFQPPRLYQVTEHVRPVRGLRQRTRAAFLTDLHLGPYLDAEDLARWVSS